MPTIDPSSWPCPVPKDQQPLEEYQALKESGFFRWGTLERWPYLRQLLWIWSLSWIVTGPVAAASFPLEKDPFHFSMSASAGAIFFLALIYVRLYLGWKYVCDRLNDPVISYEESGWYDGQLWEKSPEALAQDRLIVTYQVKPILQRLHWTFAGLGIVLGTETIGWVCF